MYKPTPVEQFSYEDYKEYISNMINEIKEDNKKDVESIRENLRLYNTNPEGVSYVSIDGINCVRVENKNPNYFIEAVGLSNKVYLRNMQCKKLSDELDYLNTEDGKQEYIEKKGRYSNTVLL